MIYFDYNANWPISEQTIKDYNVGCKVGNISCATALANYGKQITAELREMVIAEHGSGYNMIFTSGGSESNSTAINHYIMQNYIASAANGIPPQPIEFVSSTVEHSSVTEYLTHLAQNRIANISWVKPQSNGEVRVEDIMERVTDQTSCVFLQSVNSETGCVQNITLLGLQLAKLGIPFHVDNVQGFKKIKYPANIGDTISISFHKIGAPLGIGAFLFRDKQLFPLIAGKQNDGKRGGTYNIGAIIATYGIMKKYTYECISAYKKYFLKILARFYTVVQYEKLSSVYSKTANFAVLFSDDKCLPNTIFMAIIRNGTVICGEKIKTFLFRNGITIGTGSACNSENKTSLGSMASSDIKPSLKTGFIRISYGCGITEQQLERLANALGSAVNIE